MQARQEKLIIQVYGVKWIQNYVVICIF
jgi:hypothetical protein